MSNHYTVNMGFRFSTEAEGFKVGALGHTLTLDAPAAAFDRDAELAALIADGYLQDDGADAYTVLKSFRCNGIVAGKKDFNAQAGDVLTIPEAPSTAPPTEEIQPLIDTGYITEADPPTVESTDPDDEDTDVAISVHPAVTFSEAMAPATLLTTTVKLLDEASAQVTCTIALSAGNTVATLTPTAPLSNSMTYRIRVTTAVTDVAGNHLATQFTQATGFTTVDA